MSSMMACTLITNVQPDGLAWLQEWCNRHPALSIKEERYDEQENQACLQWLMSGVTDNAIELIDTYIAKFQPHFARGAIQPEASISFDLVFVLEGKRWWQKVDSQVYLELESLKEQPEQLTDWQQQQVNLGPRQYFTQLLQSWSEEISYPFDYSELEDILDDVIEDAEEILQ
ncbi:hypothetical protein [Zooshikella ganghwensis]|uniref:Uncharacterized protein n=1 Tax=Zooshikella ganghwensis TaxID=202772 RepID=A0A4P9VMM0_9GAMM|nr:hypothetical protein [Zooshikella ganghwensis]RDH43634.1 hypothetical protein B9G39_09360 [Zooshikella ganghwensis]